VSGAADPPYYSRSWQAAFRSARALRARGGLEGQLLLLAGLPLADGVFVGGLTSGAVDSTAGAVAFGTSVFSGAGCLAVAMALEGGVASRLAAVARVYVAVLAAAAASALLLPWLAPLLLPNFHLVSALVLLGVAHQLWPSARGPLSAPPGSGVVAPWTWAARAALLPQVPLVVGVALSALSLASAAATGEPPAARQVPPVLLTSVLLAVGAATAETALGALAGAVCGRRLPRAALRRGGALALVVIAASAVGAPIPDALPLATLPATLVVAGAASLVRRTRSRKAGDGVSEAPADWPALT
jgi:hypothetical protein